MDRVGGDYNSYQALRENARDYDDVLVMMAGEADAQKVRDVQARAARGA